MTRLLNFENWGYPLRTNADSAGMAEFSVGGSTSAPSSPILAAPDSLDSTTPLHHEIFSLSTMGLLLAGRCELRRA